MDIPLRYVLALLKLHFIKLIYKSIREILDNYDSQIQQYLSKSLLINVIDLRI